MTIEPNGYKILKDENEQLKEENYKLQNALIEQQLTKYDNIEYINKLKQELFNNYLIQQHQERLIKDLKLALSSYDNFVDEWYPD